MNDRGCCCGRRRGRVGRRCDDGDSRRRLAVVNDPFGNPLVVLDLCSGRYRTDADGNVVGVERADDPAPDA